MKSPGILFTFIPAALLMLAGLGTVIGATAPKTKEKSTVSQASKEDASSLPKTNAEWKKRLTPEQYSILRRKGTERAFTGQYWNAKAKGMYRCAGCGQPLFASDAKFDSGTGWPSFWAPYAPDKVGTKSDTSHLMHRTEVLCSRCGGHLGHVFPDGPPPTGLRYCINSAALELDESSPDTAVKVVASAKDDTPGGRSEPSRPPDAKSGPTLEKATFGAGCFWCTEAVFERLKGVQSVVSGYSGGHVNKPSYKQVSSGRTGHAEVVQVTYDPKRVSYAELLEVFWGTHDPTTRNRQGPDVGTQYRSVIFYHNDEQRKLAEQYREKLDGSGAFRAPIVTEIAPFREFFPAENYHQDYYELNGRQPYCQSVIRPKVEKLKKVFADKLKDRAEQPAGGTKP